ncbi:MAG: ECF transporter S component [Oscillospiraceae bacterium]
MQKSRNESVKVRKIVKLSLLSALIVIMTFTFLGYLRVGLIEISFLAIPVAIGAILMGPGAGLILGTVFGLTSFLQCFGFSALGVALLAINPLFTLLVCLVPRMLMGYLTGLLFKGLSKAQRLKNASYPITCLFAALMNTVFFIGLLFLLFGNSDVMLGIKASLGATSTLAFMVAFAGINALVEAAACTVIGGTVSKILAAVEEKNGLGDQSKSTDAI